MLDRGTVIFWNNRYGFARADRGGQVYIGVAELQKAGIVHLEAGTRLVFQIRKSIDGGKPRAARIRLEPTA
jgi:cold shock CspA family protein